MVIEYLIECNISVEEFRHILLRSGLSERRPIDDLKRIEAMVQYSNLIITARKDGELVGVARAITDFEYCTYLSDLAVDISFQRQGIGKELLRMIKMQTPNAKLILLAAPASESYYPGIGMHRHNHCYILDDIADLR